MIKRFKTKEAAFKFMDELNTDTQQKWAFSVAYDGEGYTLTYFEEKEKC